MEKITLRQVFDWFNGVITPIVALVALLVRAALLAVLVVVALRYVSLHGVSAPSGIELAYLMGAWWLWNKAG